METNPEALDIAGIFTELGLIIVVLALLARLGVWLQFPPVPFYLLAGLVFGSGAVLPLDLPDEFIQIGAEIGVILLLFMLGLAYTGHELTTSLRTALPFGILNLLTSFPPGVIFALLMDWEPLAAVVMGGVTYVSSSGIIAKTLDDLEWMGNRETPTVLSILVIEDLTMAVYLPLLVVLLLGQGMVAGAVSLAVAITTVIVVLLVAVRYGERISERIFIDSDEVVLLTTLGLILMVAGIAQSLQVSSAVGAFLVGIGLSGQIAERARILLTPLRDLFAAVFFLFFGLQIDAASLPPVLGVAALLVVVSILTKFITGYLAAQRSGIALRGRFRAGVILVPRGEFSIVVAGLGAGAALDAPDLVPVVAAYVLLMAIFGPILAKVVDPSVAAVQRRLRARRLRRRKSAAA